MSTNYTHDSDPSPDPSANLTPAELERVEQEIALEMSALPLPPTIDDLRKALGKPPTRDALEADGHTESATLLATIDFISGLGRVLTLITAEAIQALAAIIIAIVFAMLEYQRVESGAGALGQTGERASLIAFAVVTANVVHPIYALRQLRGQRSVTITRHTARGYWDAFWDRLLGRPTSTSADLHHNPTLGIAASVITWSTILLAVYDILGPLLDALAKGTNSDPFIISGMKLVMGFGLSIAGVFFLQAASHEIGVRILTDQPVRLAAILAERQADYASREADVLRLFQEQQAAYQTKVADTRQNVRRRFVQGKLADRERRRKESTHPAPFPFQPVPSTNGNGHHNGNGHV